MKGRLTGDALRRAIRYAMGRHRVEQSLAEKRRTLPAHLPCHSGRHLGLGHCLRHGVVQQAYQTVYGPVASPSATSDSLGRPDSSRDRDAVVANLRLVLESARSTYGQLNIVSPKRRHLRLYRESRVCVCAIATTPYRMIGAKTDITERRRAETMHAVQLARRGPCARRIGDAQRSGPEFSVPCANCRAGHWVSYGSSIT